MNAEPSPRSLPQRAIRSGANIAVRVTRKGVSIGWSAERRPLARFLSAVLIVPVALLLSALFLIMIALLAIAVGVALAALTLLALATGRRTQRGTVTMRVGRRHNRP